MCSKHMILLFLFAAVQCLTIRTYSPGSDCTSSPRTILIAPNATCVGQGYDYFRYTIDLAQTTLVVCRSYTSSCSQCISTDTYSSQTSCASHQRTFSASDDTIPSNFVVIRYRTSSACNSSYNGVAIATAPYCSSGIRIDCALGVKRTSFCSLNNCSHELCELGSTGSSPQCQTNSYHSYSETCGSPYSTTCSAALVQRVMDEFNDMLNAPRTFYAYDPRSLFLNVVNNALDPCTSRIKALQFSTLQNTTIMTDACYPVDSSSSDPCCNPLLRQCCLPRPQTFSTHVINYKFDNCNSAARVRPLLMAYNKILNGGYLQSEEHLGPNTILGCINSALSQGYTYCNSDSMCPFSGRCSANSCVPPATLADLSHQTAKCILVDGLANPTFPVTATMRALFLIGSNLALDTSVDALANHLQNTYALGTGSCFQIAQGFSPPLFYYTTSSSCLSSGSLCNDRTRDLSSCVGSFCGHCPNIHSCTVLSHSEATCANYVVCSNNTGQWVHKDTCIGTGKCINAPCPSNVLTQAQCQNAGEGCSSNSECYKKCYVSNKIYCPSGIVGNSTYYYCDRINADCTCLLSKGSWTSADCASIGGSLRDHNDRTSCESYKYCRYTRGGYTYSMDLPADQCSICGGTIVNKHSFGPATWVSNNAVYNAQWTPRQYFRGYDWVTPGFDYNKFRNKLISIFSASSFHSMNAAFRRSYFSAFELIKRISCDCDINRGSTDCFKDPLKYPMGSVTAVPGFTQTVKLGEVAVTTKPNSFSPSRGNMVSLGITRTHLSFESSSTTPVSTVPIQVEDNGRMIGQIVGHGAALDQSPDGPVTLCISLEPEVNISGSFMSHAFAIFNNGKYVKVGNTVSVQNNQHCADVTDTQTYYPARLEGSPTPPQPISTPKPPAPQPTSKMNAAAQSPFNSLLYLSLFAIMCLLVL